MKILCKNFDSASRTVPTGRNAAAVEPLERRQLLTTIAPTPLGQLGLGFSTSYQLTPGSHVYRFTLAAPSTIDAGVLGNGTATLFRNDKVMATGQAVSRSVLGTGKYELVVSNTNHDVLTLKTGTLAAPTRVQASNWGGNSINLNWDDNSDGETGYRIDRWTKAGWKKAKTVAPGDTAAVIDNLKPNSVTSYRVSAQASDGFPARSVNLVTATTEAVDTTGWYRVKLSPFGKGEAAWDMREDNLKVLNSKKAVPADDWSKWEYAASWQAAVRQVVQSVKTAAGGTQTPEPVKIHDNTTMPYDWNRLVPHSFPTGGDFKVNTAGQIKAEVEADGQVFNLGISADVKLITVEDTYKAYDRDYDDWYWTVDVIKADLKIDLWDSEDEENVITKEDVSGDPQIFVAAEWHGNDMVTRDGVLQEYAQKTARLSFKLSITADEEVPTARFLWKLNDSSFIEVGQDVTKKGKVVSGEVINRSPTYTNEATSVFVVDAGYDLNANEKLDADEVWASARANIFKINITENAPLTGVDNGQDAPRREPAVLLQGLKTNSFNIEIEPASVGERIVLAQNNPGGISSSNITVPTFYAALPHLYGVTIASSLAEDERAKLAFHFTSPASPKGNGHKSNLKPLDIVVRKIRPTNSLTVIGLQLPGGAVPNVPSAAAIDSFFGEVFDNQSAFNARVVSHLGVKTYNYDLNQNGKFDESERNALFQVLGLFGTATQDDHVLIFVDQVKGPYPVTLGWNVLKTLAVASQGLTTTGQLGVAVHEFYHNHSSHVIAGLMDPIADSNYFSDYRLLQECW